MLRTVHGKNKNQDAPFSSLASLLRPSPPARIEMNAEQTAASLPALPFR